MSPLRPLTRTLLAAITAVGVAVPLLTVVAPTAGAATTQYGRVTHIDDGDTIDVDIDGDGTGKPARVRITAIQATEMYTYKNDITQWRGECHAVAAATRMHALTFGRRVRLTARSLRATNQGRIERSVAIRVGDAWRNVGSMMVNEGLVLVSYQKDEWTWNHQYRYLAQRAAALGRGIWGPEACGAGPSAEDPLRVTVNWDAKGDDQRNVNGEYIRIKNLGPTSVALGGWWVRDSALRRSTFPSGAQVLPGQTVYVHAGRGTATATHFYFGATRPMFENVTKAPTFLGDGAYLFDPEGDLRGWQQYPCVVAC